MLRSPVYSACGVVLLLQMDGLCFYCGVWVDEVLCDVWRVSVPNSVMNKCD